jgi:hypothetical protein
MAKIVASHAPLVTGTWKMLLTALAGQHALREHPCLIRRVFRSRFRI